MTKSGESTIDKVKDVLHLNKDKHATGTTTTGTTHSGTGVTGTHSGTGVTGTHSGTGVTGTHSGTGVTGTHSEGAHGPHSEGAHGPHSSNLANAADPRIDSDADGNRNYVPGTSHATGAHGPHSSAVGNTVDPRVDSTLSGNQSHGLGGNQTHGLGGNQTHGLGGNQTHGLGGNQTHGLGGNQTHGTTHAEGAHGPHSSRVANAADPRIDSDMDGNRVPNKTSAGYGTGDHFGSAGTTGAGVQHHQHQGTTAGNHVGGTGFSGGISNSSNAGPHDSNVANKVDPRVDSDLSGSGNRHGASTGGILGASGSHATPGSGTAQNTAGPHNSDLLNKVDPRVDSDRDHSKTVGGDKTFA